MQTDQAHWWQSAILYQIYVRSFQDTDGDGVGDLRGVLSKLDYLKELGVTAVWLCPIYPSPMVDFGYDITNYCDIDPVYGSLDVFDELVTELHQRRIRLVLDFVPNHTSSEHPWFKASRSSRDNPHREWYLWADANETGGPPSNWMCEQGDNGWTWDEASEQYYFHSYLPEQPDLNWRSPHVRLAMLDVLRFWLDRGVDGFRVDAVAHLIKDKLLRNNPPNPAGSKETESPTNSQIHCFDKDRPEVHEVIGWFRKLVDIYGEDRILVGETYLPPDRLVGYYGSRGLTFPFNFELIENPWKFASVRSSIDIYEARLPSDDWPNWVLGNHDCSRFASRAGAEFVRMAAVILLTLRGTPTIYYGEELGMQDISVSAEASLDPMDRRAGGRSRDSERSPMQWSADPFAGFTTGQPWLPVTSDYQDTNVESQSKDQKSLVALYKRVIQLRQATAALMLGDYHSVDLTPNVLSYVRSLRGDYWLVLANFSATAQMVSVPVNFRDGRIRFSTSMEDRPERVQSSLQLSPHEAIMVQANQEAPT